MSHREPPTVLLLMGVAGCGKSTIGQRLSRRLGWEFRDADSFHPPANIEKMSSGAPLTDEDRWPWLDAISAWIDEHMKAGTPAIVSCSALKKAYRARIIGERSAVQLVYLKGSKNLIGDRMARRKNHFMPTTLLDSQFTTLEEPGPAEKPLVVNVTLPPNRIVDQIISRCGLTPDATDPKPARGSLPRQHE